MSEETRKAYFDRLGAIDQQIADLEDSKDAELYKLSQEDRDYFNRNSNTPLGKLMSHTLLSMLPKLYSDMNSIPMLDADSSAKTLRIRLPKEYEVKDQK